MFEPGRPAGRANWEPPVDVIETDQEVIILAALPGVDAEQISAKIENGTLIIAGVRKLPAEFQTAVIHRLELPQGRFERRLPLPPGRYGAVRQGVINGCLVIGLVKA
jgi:HSP20 family molecular chaperone IbpA